MVTPRDIASMIDHSLLQPFLTEDEIRKGCEVAVKYQTASVCCRPCDLPLVAECLQGSNVKLCTVIGFPHGSNTIAVKVFEAELAMDEGCVELDMVMNIGQFKSGNYEYVEADIKAVCDAAHARGAIVKVILENCYLTDDEKKLACAIAERAGCDFVKTSTGYGTGGATIHDLQIMRKAVSEKVKVKAAGGVRDIEMALSVRAVGCARFGATATKAIVEEAEKRFAEGTLKDVEIVSELGAGY